MLLSSVPSEIWDKRTRVGLINPTVVLLAASLASLIREMMEPTTGAEAEVPYTKEKFP